MSDLLDPGVLRFGWDRRGRLAVSRYRPGPTSAVLDVHPLDGRRAAVELGDAVALAPHNEATKRRDATTDDRGVSEL